MFNLWLCSSLTLSLSEFSSPQSCTMVRLQHKAFLRGSVLPNIPTPCSCLPFPFLAWSLVWALLSPPPCLTVPDSGPCPLQTLPDVSASDYVLPFTYSKPPPHRGSDTDFESLTLFVILYRYWSISTWTVAIIHFHLIVYRLKPYRTQTRVTSQGESYGNKNTLYSCFKISPTDLILYI